ncbi:unnamed protein product [Merluccius merluccius]
MLSPASSMPLTYPNDPEPILPISRLIIAVAWGINKCSISYQPLLFPDQEKEVNAPSAKEFIRQCCRT